MIVLASLIPAVVLSILLLKTKKQNKNLEPIKVRVQNNRRQF
jgi:hypothetical protein